MSNFDYASFVKYLCIYFMKSISICEGITCTVQYIHLHYVFMTRPIYFCVAAHKLHYQYFSCTSADANLARSGGTARCGTVRHEDNSTSISSATRLIDIQA